MNVLDSSGWLEYFADGPNADYSAPVIEDVAALLVPTISVYEVFKRILQQVDEGEALQAIAIMGQGQVIELDLTVAIHAAKLSAELKIPMADSIMLASARLYGATPWTQDADFSALTDVQYKPKL